MSEKKNTRQQLGAKADEGFAIEPEKLVLVTDKAHPLYDERVLWPVDERYVLSIMKYGFASTILCRRNGDQLEVVDGRQRVKSALEANKRLREGGNPSVLVRVRLKRFATDVELNAVMNVLNSVRTDDDPLTRAQKMQRLIDLGGNDEDVMAAFGLKSLQTVKATLAVLDCSKKVKAAIASGAITATVVTKGKLYELTHEEQDKALDKVLAAGATKGTGGVHAIERAKKGKPVAVEDKRAEPKMLRRGYLLKIRDAHDEHIAEEEHETNPDHNAINELKLSKSIISFVLGDQRALKQLRELAKVVKGLG